MIRLSPSAAVAISVGFEFIEVHLFDILADRNLDDFPGRK
jgi:hypothetical protein